VVALTFFVIVGALVRWQFGAARVATTLWGVGAAFAAVYYLVPPLRRPLHDGWMRAVMPLGWLVSHLVLGVIYYLILTPTGLLMRAFGRDRLRLRARTDAPSHWVERSSSDDPSRYLRQS
jgi:hypothetical protein